MRRRCHTKLARHSQATLTEAHCILDFSALTARTRQGFHPDRQAIGAPLMQLVLPGTASLGLFVAAALTLLLIPGPAVLYIISRSVEQGRLAGFVSDLGIHTATLVHVLAASLGLSALLMSSALAFAVVKYLGAAYLIWLGLRKLLGSNGKLEDMPASPRLSRLALFRDGFIVNLLNPKTALFFFAFLPQFVDQAESGEDE